MLPQVILDRTTHANRSKLCPLHWYKAGTPGPLAWMHRVTGCHLAHPSKPPDPWSCFQAALPREIATEPLVQMPSGCRCYVTAFTHPLKQGCVWPLCLDKSEHQTLSDTCLQQPHGCRPLLFYKMRGRSRGCSRPEGAPLLWPAHRTHDTIGPHCTLRVALSAWALLSAAVAGWLLGLPGVSAETPH